jgi:hypothetical protein
MPFNLMKAAPVGVWVLVLAAIALSVDVSSPAGWMLLAVLGLVPPVMLFWMSERSAQTMSESIREVLK